MKNFRANMIDWLALVLVTIGALNWGLIGAANFLTDGGNWNLVNLLLGSSAILEFGVYLLVGLAAIYTIYFAYRLGTVERTDTVDDVTGKARRPA